MSRSAFPICLVLPLLISFVGVPDATAQSPELPESASYVPQAGLAAVVIRPQPIINYPDVMESTLRLFPIEVVEAWGAENLGVNPLSLAELKVVVGMPVGPGPPPLGMVFTLLEDFDPENLSEEMLAAGGPTTNAGRTLYPLAVNGRETGMVLEMIDARRGLIGEPTMLQSMRNAKEGAGPLAELLRQNPIGTANVQLAFAIRPLRPLIGQAVQNVPDSEELPPAFIELIRGAELVHALNFRARIDGSKLISRTEILGDDAEGAAELFGLIENAIASGKEMYLSSVEEMPLDVEPGPVADALRSYLRRLGDEMLANYRPRLSDDRVVLDIQSNTSIASIGFMTGLLLPAVQSARQAARRMSSSNNLKQLGLAMHNHHDAFQQLPAAAITDEDGTPLLSWRVAILPFVEEQPLYSRFKLDEPWDSPHNIKLLDEMPSVFKSPGITLAPGNTVYHLMIGEGLAISPTGKSRFRDFTDGLSNTLLMVEGNADSQVPWTAPQPIEIPEDDPLQPFRGARTGGFNASLADGFVRFISDSIDLQVFRALLTRAGGEPSVPNF